MQSQSPKHQLPTVKPQHYSFVALQALVFPSGNANLLEKSSS